jgi:pimeloyl-ACP methyl ester carboxylesterase
MFTRRQSLQFGAGVFSASAIARAAEPQARKVYTEEMFVPASDSGIKIFVRNKRPADMTAFRPERTLLFVHGSTYPSSTTFDLQLGGMSWMDYIAEHGFDVYLLDLRGYGRSIRPKEMDEKPDTNPAIVRGVTAVKDISTVVDFILKRRKIARLNLLGWSWGTTLMATYTTQNPSKVRRLVLYAPQWVRSAPPTAQAGTRPIGAYRAVQKEGARGRWLNGVPEDKKESLIPAGWYDAWANATWASDPVGAKMEPPVLRAPNGTVQDNAEFWTAGKPYYDPAKITVPTLITLAEWDRDNPLALSLALFPLLVNAPDKRLVLLPEGTHFVMMERKRLSLFKTVQAFLTE